MSRAGLPSRGQGAYHGHAFWDESLSLPFLALHMPDVVRSVLVHRHERLDMARQRACKAGLRGALFPWRSGTSGIEETPQFQQNPKSDRWLRDDTRLQFHVSSAIAQNVWRYFLATRDIDFMARQGVELMVEVARMWASLARPHPDHPRRFTLRGVVGPDEFHTRYPGAEEPGLNDETYTNIMAAWALDHAAEALACLSAPDRSDVAARLSLDDGETEDWAVVARGLHLPVDADGTFLPFDGYEALQPVDLAAHEREHPGERLDWFIEAGGGDINGLQAQKQATFAMLVHLLSLDEVTAVLARMGYAASHDVIRRTIKADLERTSHDSSLSNLVYAGALAGLSPAISARRFADSLHPDEQGGHSGTEKGVHLGAMAATLDITQRIYLGIRPSMDALILAPTPPLRHLGAIRMQVLFRGSKVTVAHNDGRLHICAERDSPAPVPLLVQGIPLELRPGTDYRVEVVTTEGA